MSSKESTSISIVSACRNERAHIQALLDCVLSQESLPDDWEVVIADGLSTDGTREIVAEYVAREPRRVRLVENRDRYTASGLNAAIRVATGRIILRMDAHTIYAPDYVRTCVELLNATGAQNVGGPARTITDGRLHTAIAAAYHSSFSSGGARFHDPDYEGWAETVTYGCWHRETLEQLGLFDESMIRNQDDELNLRLIRAGGRIWQSPRIVSWYQPRASLAGLFRQYYQYGFWKVAVIRKHRLPARWQQLIPGLFVLAQGVLLALLTAAGLAGWRLLFQLSAASYLLIAGTYLTLAVLVSLRIAARQGWYLVALLPVVFATYHMSYGLGFLWGVVKFGLLRHGGSRVGRLATELTR